jgi:uncharacterized membrane protein YcaP (DUF421 family)
MPPIIEYVWTPVMVFIVGYILVRLAGKKAVSEMNSFDLLFILIVGTSISEPIVSKNNWLAVWYSSLIALLYIGLSKLSLNNRFKRFLTASPTVLIRGGDIDEKGLRHVHLSVQELLEEIRVKGYTKTADIELAVMEETGNMSVIPKAQYRPLQPSDLQMVPAPTFIPIPLIIDGEIVEHNMNFLKKDKSWLALQLKAFGMDLDHLHNITLATFNQQGTLDIDTDNPHDHDQGVYNYKPGDDN